MFDRGNSKVLRDFGILKEREKRANSHTYHVKKLDYTRVSAGVFFVESQVSQLFGLEKRIAS